MPEEYHIPSDDLKSDFIPKFTKAQRGLIAKKGIEKPNWQLTRKHVHDYKELLKNEHFKSANT